mmetsp:Transcript_21897/g.73659  ORF Transcript_21897/g.73659 Transcript_21897/m.73659 type:complete len:245 (-) Transcript_21897:612-1346(-)
MCPSSDAHAIRACSGAWPRALGSPPGTGCVPRLTIELMPEPRPGITWTHFHAVMSQARTSPSSPPESMMGAGSGGPATTARAFTAALCPLRAWTHLHAAASKTRSSPSPAPDTMGGEFGRSFAPSGGAPFAKRSTYTVKVWPEGKVVASQVCTSYLTMVASPKPAYTCVASQARARGVESYSHECSHRPVVMSHTRTRMSSDAVTMRDLSGVMATELTHSSEMRISVRCLKRRPTPEAPRRPGT